MPNSEYIIRYISLGKFIEMLNSCTLHLSRIDLFEDKTEGEWYAHLAKSANADHWYIEAVQKVMSTFNIEPEKLNLAEIRTDLG